MQQRRKFTRVAFRAHALVLSRGTVIQGVIENLSLSGMLLRTPERVQIGKTVDLRVFITGPSSELVLTLMGVIVRHSEDGMGIEFTKMDLDSLVHIRHIVSHALGDEETVSREFLSHIAQKSVRSPD